MGRVGGMKTAREILSDLRQAFPQPVSDPVHDAYFVFSILRALDQVDGLKSNVPILGAEGAPDYAEASTASLRDDLGSIEGVTRELVDHLRGLPNWGHPRNQVNVIAPPSIASIIGGLLPSIYNPNLVSEESSMRVLQAEVEVAGIAAELVGYDPSRSAGVFTFGGTGTNLYAVRIGLEKAWPGTRVHGLRGPAVIVASAQAHYSKSNIAGWIGIGEENVVSVRSNLDSEVDLAAYEAACRRSIEEGRRLACLVATMGTTDAFGIDDLASIVEMRDRLVDDYGLDYRPHVHADAVIGWAWSIFRGYDFEANPMEFRPRTARALARAMRRIGDLAMADSIGFDFHKTGFCPYVSSLFLARDRDDFGLLVRERETMPYLFQSGSYHPGVYTLETSRSGSGVLAALASLRYFGREGLRSIIGHLVEMAEVLREHLEAHEATSVLNGGNVGAVTLFRVYPSGVDTWSIKERERTDPAARDELRRHNDFNRRVFEELHREAMSGQGVLISMTDSYRSSDYGEPIAALKSFSLSPFLDEEHMRLLVDKVLEARNRVENAASDHDSKTTREG